MIRADLQTPLVGADLRLRQRRGGGLELVPRPPHLDRPLRAVEDRQVAAVLELELHAVAVAASNVPVRDRAEEALGRDRARALDLDGHGLLEVPAPDRDIERMGAPAAEETDGVVVHVPRSPARAAILRVGRDAGRSQPPVVVQIVWNGNLRRRSARPAGRGVHFDLLQVADPPVDRQFARVPQVRAGPLLRAVLEHIAIPLDGLAQGDVPLHAQTERLLDVHILARPRRGQGGRHVPVVGRGDDNGVDVVAGEQLAEVRVRGGELALVLLVDPGDRAVAATLERVGDGDAAAALQSQKAAQNPPAASAHADVPHRDAVARGISAENRRGHDRGQGDDRRRHPRTLQEPSSRGLVSAHRTLHLPGRLFGTCRLYPPATGRFYRLRLLRSTRKPSGFRAGHAGLNPQSTHKLRPDSVRTPLEGGTRYSPQSRPSLSGKCSQCGIDFPCGLG